MKLFRENKILRFLGSLKLALFLFCAIILVCFIGAILPSILPEDRQLDFFGSGWFFALLTVFGLNIAICAFSRLSFAAKKIGSTLVHLSVLLILLGSMLSYFFSIRGTMEIEEGQSQDRLMLGCKIHKLDFRVHLEDFAIDWYSAEPDKYEIRARVDPENILAAFRLNKAQEQKIANTGYSFALKDYFSDFGLDENMRAYNKSSQPNNPAVLIGIISPSGAQEERWVFANHPGMGMDRDNNIKFRFNFQPQVREYRSRVRVIDEKNNLTRNALIKVNQPLSYKGYSFYQVDYDHDQLKYTVLEGVYDPGVRFVFAGFLLLNLGLGVIFYPKLKPGPKTENK